MDEGNANVMQSSSRWGPLHVAVIVVLIISAVFAVVATGRTTTPKLQLTVSADRPGKVKVYFDVGKGFSETLSYGFQLGNARQSIGIELPESAIRAVRIDPAERQTWFRVHSLKLQTARGEIDVPLAGVSARRHVKGVEKRNGYVEARMSEGAGDPQLLVQLELKGPERSETASFIAVASKTVLWTLAVGLLATYLMRLQYVRPKLSWLTLAPSMLILCMAWAAPTDVPVNPDEGHHVRAAAYHFTHWLPGNVLDASMASTYDSIWGVSYLNTLDVVYFFSAKISNTWRGIVSDDVVALRLFNTGLFLLLAILSLREKGFSRSTVVLLLTPQVWYVFSYFNGDALPLFLSMCAVALAIPHDSSVSSFIEGGRANKIKLAFFVVVIGLLLVSKPNYLVVICLVGMLLLWRHLKPSLVGIVLGFAGITLLAINASSRGEIRGLWPAVADAINIIGALLFAVFAVSVAVAWYRQLDRRPVARLALLFFLAALVALPRLVVDYSINGGTAQKAEMLAAATEDHARKSFKPSTLKSDLSNAHPGLRMAARGVSLRQLLWQQHSWLEDSWRSFFGVYGYMDVFVPVATYWLLSVGLLAFLAMLIISMVGDPASRGVLLIVASALPLTILSSLSLSWFYGYQPQGRYLLALIPIAGALLVSCRADARWPRAMPVVVIACFVLSVYSFVSAMPSLVQR